jgi:PPOX class probable F420-dependent enzyme
MPVGDLGGRDRALLGARRAVLATVAGNGSPRAVPICFVFVETTGGGIAIYSPLDEKPKRSPDPRSLARVQDILARPAVVVLLDSWDEDWNRLAWVQLRGNATLLEPGSPEHREAVSRLRAKYSQYAGHALDSRPMVKVEVTSVRSWAAAGAG